MYCFWVSLFDISFQISDFFWLDLVKIDSNNLTSLSLIRKKSEIWKEILNCEWNCELNCHRKQRPKIKAPTSIASSWNPSVCCQAIGPEHKASFRYIFSLIMTFSSYFLYRKYYKIVGEMWGKQAYHFETFLL